MHTVPKSTSTVAAPRGSECLSSYQIALASLGVMSISVSMHCSAGGAEFACSDSASVENAGLCAWQMHQIAGHIERHIHAPIRTIDLAQVLQISVSHFSRAFKRACGMTPREYILRKRIAHACIAMRQRECNLTDIAHLHGFCDQSHFTRVFRKLTGSSPLAWRENHVRDLAPQSLCRV